MAQIEMQSCGNCGAPITQKDKCTYCGSYIKDPVSNAIDNYSFRYPYPT